MVSNSYYLSLAPGQDPVHVPVSQYDAGSRDISMTLYTGSELFTIPLGASIVVQGTKKDRTGFQVPCTYEGATVSFTITEQMTVFAGEVPCELSISTALELLGTANFYLDVEEAALANDVVISETDLPLIQQAIALAPTITSDAYIASQSARAAEAAAELAEGYAEQSAGAIDAAETAVTSAASAAASKSDSEAYAIGKRNGVDVPSSDPAYHNNSKYYADAISSAGQQALDAEAWAVGQRGGVDVGSADATYHNNSKYYAQQVASIAGTLANIDLDQDGIVDEAEAVSLNGATGVIKFGVDSQGNYGYIAPGADSVTPFRSSSAENKKLLFVISSWKSNGTTDYLALDRIDYSDAMYSQYCSLTSGVLSMAQACKLDLVMIIREAAGTQNSNSFVLYKRPSGGSSTSIGQVVINGTRVSSIEGEEFNVGDSLIGRSVMNTASNVIRILVGYLVGYEEAS